MSKSKWIAIGLFAVLAGGAATAALAGDGAPESAPAGKHGGKHAGKHQAGKHQAGQHTGRRGALRERAQQAMKQRRQGALEFLASLNATDDQRRLVLDKARAAAPIVAAARSQARQIIAQAWAAASKDKTVDRKAAREAVKARLQTLREATKAQIEPLAKEVVTSITPEQRQKFTQAAGKRGATIDDAKLTKFATRLITRPMTIAFLEAKLGR